MDTCLRRIRTCIVAIGILALVAASAGALEIKEGRIKLILHEDIGRFSLYYLTDLQKGTYVPLFVDKDPRTSSTTLVVDNRVSRLGDSAEYQQEAKRTSSGAAFVWTSRLLTVQQSFDFVTSAGSQLADGIRMTVSVKNQGEQPAQIGLRLLVDTYFGEEGAYHFLLDGQKQVTRETELTGSSRPASWTSPRHGDASGFGLICLTAGEAIDTPDRIVFANWQRLNDSSWSFQVSSSRGFSNLPYSINDSAVAMYYGPRTVEAGKTTSISTVLAAATGGTFKLATAAAAASAAPKTTSELLSAIASTGGIADPLLAGRTDLLVLNELLRSIDARLANPGDLTDQEIEALRSAVRDLGARVRKYAGEQTSASPRP
jgi:hypothetical protein